MNNQATIEKMQQLRLHGMTKAFRATMESGVSREYTPDELLAHLVDAEWDDRYNRKLERLIRNANFRYKAGLVELDYKASRNIDKNQILRFADCDWIRKGENIVITGATGVGKSFISSALGYNACMNGFKVLYMNALKIFSTLKYCKADGTYLKEVGKIQKQDLIILDDFGLKVLDNASRLMLLEIIEDRHGKKSSIFSSQLPVSNWHEIIGESTIADAICDRLIHNSHRIELKGDSMRRKSRNPEKSCQ